MEETTENAAALAAHARILQDYKEHLLKVMDANADRFEKQLSYISAGALGVSMAFIKDVVGSLNHTDANWLLLLGWMGMGGTLLINLVSQVYANNCHSQTVFEIDCDTYDSKRATKRRDRIIRLNYISVALLILGIILLIIFVSKNI